MKFIEIVRKIMNPFKLDLKIFPDLDLRRRIKLLNYYEINKILDVGANNGQYAEIVQKIGFKGEIISFEPVKSTFKILEKKANSNQKWKTLNYGLGPKNDSFEINISANTSSSSILEIMPNVIKSEPETKTIRKEKILIKTLDNIYTSLVKPEDNVLLKLDVQGFEKNVLDGATESLKKIKGIQIEMSIEELYRSEMLFAEMLLFLNSKGFSLHSLENGFYDEKTGKLLQVDGIFFRKNK